MKYFIKIWPILTYRVLQGLRSPKQFHLLLAEILVNRLLQTKKMPDKLYVKDGGMREIISAVLNFTNFTKRTVLYMITKLNLVSQ